MSRQPNFSTAARPSRARAWDRIAFAASVLAALFVAGFAWSVRQEADQAASRLAEVRQEVAQQTERLRGLVERRQSRASLAAGTPSAPARIVAGLVSVLPKDARLERLTIDYARGVALELQVEARDAAAWDRLLERMERSPDFADVAPGPESREAEVRSVVHARWKGGR